MHMYVNGKHNTWSVYMWGSKKKQPKTITPVQYSKNPTPL